MGCYLVTLWPLLPFFWYWARRPPRSFNWVFTFLLLYFISQVESTYLSLYSIFWALEERACRYSNNLVLIERTRIFSGHIFALKYWAFNFRTLCIASNHFAMYYGIFIRLSTLRFLATSAYSFIIRGWDVSVFAYAVILLSFPRFDYFVTLLRLCDFRIWCWNVSGIQRTYMYQIIININTIVIHVSEMRSCVFILDSKVKIEMCG